MLHSLCLQGLFLSLLTPSIAQSSISLSAIAKATDAPASSGLDASFAGFGIESSNLFSFTGGNEPNDFSVQLLQNLANYSGVGPHIRLGGNTQDYMIYDESYQEIAWKDNPDSTAQGEMAADAYIIGPGYFKALDRFPTGTPITFGLNLAYEENDYLDRIVRAAQAAVDGMKNVKLYSFEVGNEPDLWLKNQFRVGAWDGAEYTQQFLDRADAVYNRVLKPAGLPAQFFESPATASTIGTTFEIAMLVKDGLTNEMNGNKYVSAWNQHDYFSFIGVTTTPITLSSLMDLDATNTQFAYWEKQVKIGLGTGLPYVLREMSSVGPIGMHGVSDVHGAALWTLNFFLYAATLDISSVQMHMTDNSNASAWQPINLYGNAPFVRPQYYAHAAMAQIIGNGNGTTQIASISTGRVGGAYAGHVRAYAAYANGDLQAVILINSKEASVAEANKDSLTFELNLGSSNADKDVFVSYLTGDGADSFDTTTFNGIQYSNTTGKPSQINDNVSKFRTSSSGSVAIPVRDSEAVVANIGWLLGSNAVQVSDGPRPKKSAAGPSSTSGANTATWAGALTTTFAVLSTVTGGAHTDERGEAENRNWAPWTMIACLVAVMVGFVLMA